MQNTEQILERGVCRNLPMIDDSRFHYVVVVDKIEDEKIQYFAWMSGIDLAFVCDFNTDEKLWKYNKAKKAYNSRRKIFSLEEVQEVVGKGLSSNQFRQELGCDERNPWIISSSLELDQKFSEWKLSAKHTISSTLGHLTSTSVVGSVVDFVYLVLIDSECHAKRMHHMVSLISEYVKDISQIVVISPNDEALRSLKLSISHEIDNFENKCIHVSSWNYLSTFMEARVNRPTETKLRLPSSDRGDGISITQDKLTNFQDKGLDILGLNHGKHIGVKNQEQTRIEANRCIKDYLWGKQPSWDLFAFTFETQVEDKLAGVFVRPYVKRLKRDVEELQRTEGELVQMKRIYYQPGSGASTITRHVLWELRDRMRCVCVDRNMSFIHLGDRAKRIFELVRALMDFRQLEESTDKPGDCCPLLVMLDNSNQDTADDLKNAILTEFRKRSIWGDGAAAQVIILYHVHTPDTDIGRRNDDLTVQQKLLPEEKKEWKNRLEVIPEQDVPTVFSFVLMSADFDYKDDYVGRTIAKYMEGLEHYTLQKKLLLYLSFISVYTTGGASLPELHCRHLIQRSYTKVPIEFMDILCPTAQLLVMSEREGNLKGEHKFVRIPHLPAAKCLFEVLSKGKTKSSIMLELLGEKIIKHPFEHDYVHMTLRQLLVKRSLKKNANDDHEQRLRYSTLVLEIMKEENVKCAIELLKEAFKTIDDMEKPYVGQALSRLLMDEGNYPEAKSNIEEAIRYAESGKRFNLHACYDTYGQIFKQEFLNLEKTFRERKSCYKMKDLKANTKEEPSIMEVAKNGSEKFDKAIHFFETRTDHKDYIFDQVFIGDMSAIQGDIQIRLTALKLILGAEVFKKNEDLRKSFLTALRTSDTIKWAVGQRDQETRRELDQLETIHKEFMVGATYTKLKERLVEAVRRVATSDYNLQNIERSCAEFNELFLENVMEMEWRRLIKDTTKDQKEKLKVLREKMLEIETNNCKTMTKRPLETLKIYQELMLEVQKLSEAMSIKLEKNQEKNDRISTINIFFCLNWHAYDNIEITTDTVKNACKELVKENETKPWATFNLDAFVFFVMLHWPAEKVSRLKIPGRCLGSLICIIQGVPSGRAPGLG